MVVNPQKTRDSSPHSVGAEGSGGRHEPVRARVNKLIEGGSQAEASDIAPIGPPVVSDESSGALAGEIEIAADSFVQVFHVKKFRLASFHSICRDVDGLPKSCLQVGISLAQILGWGIRETVNT